MGSTPTGPSSAAIKKLFATSMNRCAFPRCSTAIFDGSSLIGQICHIRAASLNGPRHDVTQSAIERHSSDNLILLCANHHTVIDSDPESYTVERLHKMKHDHEKQATTLDRELIERGSRLLVRQSIQSISQSGGITAETVNIHLHQTPLSREPAPDASDASPQTAELGNCSCFEAGGEKIAHTDSRQNDGRTNEHVYWHHNPSAWLRIIPPHSKAYGRSLTQRLVETAAMPLLAFGESEATGCFPNKRGTAVLGIDGDMPQTIATKMTQVLLNGEIWGLNRAMIDPKPQEPTRIFQIPWPQMKFEFESTLSNYLHFARETLKLKHPLTAVAGLAMVDGAAFIREKSAWFHEPPKPKHCFEPFIWRSWEIGESDVAGEGMFEEFYAAVWNACTLDYLQEPRTHTWPQSPPHQQ